MERKSPLPTVAEGWGGQELLPQGTRGESKEGLFDSELREGAV